MVNKQNFKELTKAWRNTYVSTVTPGQLTLGKAAENVFDLSSVKVLITTPKEIILSPFEMQTVSAVSKVTGQVKWVHVIADPRNRASLMR